MRPFFHLAVVALLIAVAPSRCLALRSVGIITKEEAKKLGIELRATPAGPDAAWLELEFQPTGKLKDFTHVELQIMEGEKPLIAYLALSGQQTDTGTVKVRFMAGRDFFDKLTLVVVTGHVRDLAGHEIRVKDFVGRNDIR